MIDGLVGLETGGQDTVQGVGHLVGEKQKKVKDAKR